MDQVARNWRQDGLHLPKFMRDFHDQKDLFKTIHETFEIKPGGENDVPWATGMEYVIDVFLWFMALHGYTLQRTRKRGEFRGIDERIAEANRRRRGQFSAMLEKEVRRAHE